MSAASMSVPSFGVYASGRPPVADRRVLSAPVCLRASDRHHRAVTMLRGHRTVVAQPDRRAGPGRAQTHVVRAQTRRLVRSQAWKLFNFGGSTTASPTETPDGTSVDLLALGSDQDGAVEAACAVFERVDDVVMGGVSSSVIQPDLAGRDCLVWSGKCRVEGGGFTGARTVALKAPLDLSAFDGISITCVPPALAARTNAHDAPRGAVGHDERAFFVNTVPSGLESDDEPERRTWKATVRTQNNRGEVVYQASFVPPVASKDPASPKPAEIRIPWESFRLVRGPVVVPDTPPLSADQCAEVYGLGLIMSRFGARGPMPDFREGPFRLALHGFGVYAGGSVVADAGGDIASLSLSAAVAGGKTSENRGTRTALTFLLAPLIALVFSEKGRRRRRARQLLKERYGMGEMKARFQFGQALKKTRKGGGEAMAEGLTELARDVAAAILTLPLRALFLAVGKLGRLMRKLKGEKPLPKMK